MQAIVGIGIFIWMKVLRATRAAALQFTRRTAAATNTEKNTAVPGAVSQASLNTAPSRFSSSVGASTWVTSC